MVIRKRRGLSVFGRPLFADWNKQEILNAVNYKKDHTRIDCRRSKKYVMISQSK